MTASVVAAGNRLGRRAVRALPDTLRHAPDKVFPGHSAFLLGELALFSFVVLVASGLYLSLFYVASGETTIYDGSHAPLVGTEVSRAYASVLDITFERPGGGVIRQTHHWAALIFVASIVLHAARVFFTGAFRSPRRLNWVIGVTLMGLAMATGFFGVALPHDMLGGTGARIGHAFAVSIPLLGPGVADLLFDGEFDNPAMLHRFWILHVIVLPLLITALLGAHMGLVWLQTHTQFPSDGRADDEVVGSRAWPGYALKTAGLFVIVGGVLLAMGAIFQIAPIWDYGPFDAAAATVPAQPDWYLGWVEGSLRILPNLEFEVFGREIPSPFLTGLMLPITVFALLYAWPFIEAVFTGERAHHHTLDRPRERPVRTALGLSGLSALTVLHLAGSHDLQSLLAGIPVDRVTVFYRVALIVVPPVVAAITYSICRSLVRSEAEGRGTS